MRYFSAALGFPFSNGTPTRSIGNIRIFRWGKFYSCLGYYYDHQEEMDQIIDEQLCFVDDMRKKQGEFALRAKLKVQ